MLIVQEVTKRWPTLSHPVLDRVDLELGAGESLWLTGRNGVGKTTLLRVLAGMIVPETGFVRIAGLSPERHRKTYQRQLALLTAGDRGLYARLTARQHLHYWGRLALLASVPRKVAVENALKRFELNALADRRVDRMSMGQRQRLRLGLTFLHQPKVLLLDEPLNSLDTDGAAMLSEEVNALLERGGACLWISPAGDERADIRWTSKKRLVEGHLTSDSL